MICIRCGTVVNGQRQCPECGSDMKIQQIACQMSNQLYNQGLDKAQIRDLSGAIELLRQSLKYNKRNIDARNLLGLVYFETGEAVSALSEWVISKNIKANDNIASEYIQKLQSDSAKLDVINQSIKKYNIALKCCREKNEDIAAIQLKKILSSNPRLIKAYHLLALIMIKNHEYKQARKVLRRASRIDKTNSTTLRFLKEIDEQTGTVTHLDGSRFPWLKAESDDFMPLEKEIAAAEESDVIQPVAFHETSAFAGMVNIIIGVCLGALLACMLIIPTMRQKISRTADEKVTEYSTALADKDSTIQGLEAEIEDSNATVDSAKQQIGTAEDQVALYENLLKANQAYQSQNYEGAMNLLGKIDRTQLSVEGISLYDSIYDEVSGQMFAKYYEEGVNYYNLTQYDQAIETFEKAMVIKDTDYYVLTYLAHSYRLSGKTEDAITTFEAIIKNYPNTRRATVAQQYIDMLNSGDTGTVDNPIVDDDAEVAAQAAAQAAAQTDAQQQSTEQENADNIYQAPAQNTNDAETVQDDNNSGEQ